MVFTDFCLGCEADPNRCAFVACGLLKYCNSTNDRKILAIDNYQRTVSEQQIGKINSRDIVNEFKGEKEPETDDTDDNDFEDEEEEEEVEETKVEKKQDDRKVESKEGAVTEGHIGQETNQEDKPRVVVVVVHQEVHDIVYVEIPLMEHLKMILVRARQQMCAFFARIRARLFRSGGSHADSSHTSQTPDSHPVDPQHQVFEKPQPRQTQPQQHMHEAQTQGQQQDQNPHNHHMQQMHATHVAEEEKFVH